MDGDIPGIKYMHGRENHYILTVQIGNVYDAMRSFAQKHLKKMEVHMCRKTRR